MTRDDITPHWLPTVDVSICGDSITPLLIKLLLPPAGKTHHVYTLITTNFQCPNIAEVTTFLRAACSVLSSR